MDVFLDRSAKMGLTQRQRDLLDLRTYYEGTQYEIVTVRGEPRKSYPWDLDRDQENRRIPAAHREPSVQLGTTEGIVDRIVELSIGLGRFPTIAAETAAWEVVRDVMLDEAQLGLIEEAVEQLVDLAVCGSTVFGFHKPDDAGGRFDSVLLEPEWCEPVFIGARFTSRARELAAEMDAIGAVIVEPVDDEQGGVAFVVPDDARSDDVVFVRYEWPVAQEVSDKRTQHAKMDRTVWYRRDYTTSAIVTYKPVEVDRGALREAPDAFVPDPFAPHDWGVVPLVWVRGRGARGADTEGRSVYTRSVQSTTRSADYSASYRTQSGQMAGSPVWVEQDVEDEVASAMLTADYQPATDDDPAVVGVGPSAVRRLTTNGESPFVGYVEMDGGGDEALTGIVRMLTRAAKESARVPQLDPEVLKGVLSGIALERLNEPSVALANSFRGRLERGWRLLSRKLAVVLGVSKNGGLTYTWPRVFALTAEDVTAWANVLVPLVAAGLYPRERSIVKLAELLEDDTAPEKLLTMILAEQGETVPVVPPAPEE